MCGIVGMCIKVDSSDYSGLNFESEIKSKFNSAIKNLSHRGPDASGLEFFFEYGVFFGHTRLAIQDLSQAGIQPMSSSDKKLTITFNGEIYNFPSLKIRLLEAGYKFNSNTDTEVILNLYKEFGESCFEMLDGIFALAIFDKEKNTTIIAKDGLGIKPLYYLDSKDAFIFSSEIKGLETLLFNQNLTLDKRSLNRYLTFQWCPGDGTPFKEVKKVNPGEILTIKNGQLTNRKSFYQLPIFRSIAKLNKDSVETITKNLDVNLRRAVHDQMLSDTPVGAFLSGGLDSSSVVAYAKEIDPSITCFTIDSQSTENDGLVDDLPYAKRVANFLDVPLEIVKVDSDMLVKNLEKMVWMLDEPLGDAAPLNVLYISELAKKNGFNVLLSGAGGDDIFTGYRRHEAMMMDNKIQLFPKSMLSAAEYLTGKLDKRITFFRRLAKFFNGSGLVGNARIINYFKWIDQRQLQSLYSEDFKQEILNDLAEQPMLDFLQNANLQSSNLDKMLALEQRFFTTDHNLIYTDKMSMAAGVEVRVPLLAKHLVEYAASIPDNLKQKGRVGKWIFKKTMEPYLPKEIIYRPKTGFGVPLRQWLNHELNEYLEELLSIDSINSRGLFNSLKIRNLIDSNYSGEIDASYTILSLMCIEVWCRQHIDS